MPYLRRPNAMDAPTTESRPAGRWWAAGLLGALALALVAAGCGGPERAALEADVEDFRLVREADGRQVVAGVFVNPSASRPIASATVEVELYDQPVEAGVEPVETIRFEVRDVAPGGRKPFRETVDTRLTLSGARVGQILVF